MTNRQIPEVLPAAWAKKTMFAETANFSRDGIACVSAKNRQSALFAPVLSSGATGDAYGAMVGVSSSLPGSCQYYWPTPLLVLSHYCPK